MRWLLPGSLPESRHASSQALASSERKNIPPNDNPNEMTNDAIKDLNNFIVTGDSLRVSPIISKSRKFSCVKSNVARWHLISLEEFTSLYTFQLLKIIFLTLFLN